MELKPLTTFRKTTNRLYLLVDAGQYLVKCYPGPDGAARRERERAMLDRWREAGFNVPEVCERTIPDLPEPRLVTRFIEGVSLRELLCCDERERAEKLDTVSRVFEDLARRHRMAVSRDDPLLVHHDPNTGNILCGPDGFTFIDFEAPPHKGRSAAEAASIEAATTCRWIARDQGVAFIEETARLMVAAYAGQESLMRRIVERTHGRAFQFVHRRRDRARKRAHPGEVTKYDIADAVSHLINE